MSLQRRVTVRRPSVETRATSSNCAAHGIPSRMYCHGCALVACAECLLERHTQHQYEHVRKVAAKYGKVLGDRRADLEMASYDYARALDAIRNRREDIVQQRERVCGSVNSAFDDAQRELEELRVGLLREAAEITERKLSSLREQEQQIVQSLSNLNSVSDLIDAFTTEPSKKEEMISSFQGLLDAVDQQEKILETTCLDPLEIPDLVANIERVSGPAEGIIKWGGGGGGGGGGADFSTPLC